MGYDIRSVYISPAVNAKINSKHGVTQDEVLDACVRVVTASWIADERGRRLYIDGKTARGRRLLVVLYPTNDPSLWNPGTAYFG